ncbi:MAG: PulJ/GspJ family protein [Rhodospirillales bacterium]
MRQNKGTSYKRTSSRAAKRRGDPEQRLAGLLRRHSPPRNDGLFFISPGCRSCRCRLSPNGFTLLEVLVAFTILALMLTVLLRIFSDGFRGMTAADVHAAAALHAQAALASVGAEIPLAVGDWSGEHEDGFRWRVSIDLYDEPTMVAPLRSFLVYRILVSAEHGSGSGTVTLSSLRIGGAEPNVTGEEGDGSPLQ